MRPKLDVLKFLYRCLTLFKFEGNPEGVLSFYVDGYGNTIITPPCTTSSCPCQQPDPPKVIYQLYMATLEIGVATTTVKTPV